MKIFKIRVMPEKFIFGRISLLISEPETGKYQIPYKDIIFIYIRIWDRESGNYWKPEIVDITREMDGELILYDKEYRQWIIRTDSAEQKAGALFEDLCIHAPYVLAGNQNWFDCSTEKDFDMVRQMVDLMRECSVR